MSKYTPNKIVEKLKDNLATADNNKSWDLLLIEQFIGICSSSLLELREYVNENNFQTREEEIHFFKVIKPYVLGEYLYFSRLFEIEIRRPVSTIRAQKRYLKKIISKVQRFFDENLEFYQYYRDKSTHLDDKYFIRNRTINCLNACHFIVDPVFQQAMIIPWRLSRPMKKSLFTSKPGSGNWRNLERLLICNGF